MIDLPNIFKDLAEANGFKFDYGTKAMLNLLRSNKTSTDIYFLLSSPLTWGEQQTEYSARPTVKGNFMLVVKSNLDNVIYRSKDQDEASTKYNKNVEPLLLKLQDFRTKLGFCSDFKVNYWKAIDGYNLLDTNTDGLIVDFELILE